MLDYFLSRHFTHILMYGVKQMRMQMITEARSTYIIKCLHDHGVIVLQQHHRLGVLVMSFSSLRTKKIKMALKLTHDMIILLPLAYFPFLFPWFLCMSNCVGLISVT